MKQRVDSRQLAYLSPQGLMDWTEWCSKKGYGTRAVIGQVIEYLKENNKLSGHIYPSRVIEYSLSWKSDTELIDMLWQRIVDLHPSVDNLL